MNKIYLIRIIDDDLAELKQVETRRLNEQVKRNADRIPVSLNNLNTRKYFKSLGK